MQRKSAIVRPSILPSPVTRLCSICASPGSLTASAPPGQLHLKRGDVLRAYLLETPAYAAAEAPAVEATLARLRSESNLSLVLVSHDNHPDNLDDRGRALALAAPLVLTTRSGAGRLGPLVELAGVLRGDDAGRARR